MKVMLIGTGPVDYALSFANGLARQAQVTLAVPARHWEEVRHAVDPALELHMMDWPRTRSPVNLALVGRIAGLARRVRPDVVHMLSNTTLWLNALPPLLHAPLVTTVHDVTVHPGDRDTAQLPGWAARRMARQSGDLVVHGEGLRAAAAAAFGKPAERVHVLPHPVIRRYADLARDRGMRPAPRDGFRLLMFGRMFAYKGLTDLLQAEARLDLPDLRITLAGRGDDPAAHAARMGRPDRYDIRHRFIDAAEVAQLFLDADAVVLPYAEASQSGVLLLAAAFGTPVIVTDVGELGSTVRDHGTGLVVPPGNPPALAAAIARLHADPALRLRLGAAMRAWAVRVSPEGVGAEARTLYEGILRRQGTPLRTDMPDIRRAN